MKMDSEDSYRSRSDVEDESSSSEYLPEQNQRRRGRGKRAGGGPTAATRNRNKGRGRGGGRRGGRGGVDKQQSAISARQTHLEECISTMETEELRRVLRRVCSKQPSFVLDILDTVMEGDGPAQAGTEGRAAPSWCVCNYCRNMPTGRERVCCGESRENCQSRRPDFSTVCLDEVVLKVAMRYYIPEPRDDNINKSRRYAAYRQYIMWVHGKLGTGRRKVIPSCCVWRIRDTFPEPSGQYAGYLNGVAKPSH